MNYLLLEKYIITDYSEPGVTMSGRPFVVSQQKLAEKLTILKDRGVGMLTRIYNIKKGRIRVF